MNRKLTLLGSVLLLLAGCSDDTTPATEADYDDVAQALSAVVATSGGGGEVGSLQDSTSIAIGEPTADITLKATGEFVGNRLGLSYDYSVTCSDVDGKTLERCGASTNTAAVNVAWSGKLAALGLTADVQREGAWTLASLKSGTAEVSGKGTFDFDVEFQSLFRNVTREYHVNYAADYAAVKVQLAAKKVVGGSVTYDIHAERKASGPRRDTSATFDMNGVLAFASDGSATLTLDDNFKYNVDTTSGVVVKTTR
jgi:hypothetical protein